MRKLTRTSLEVLAVLLTLILALMLSGCSIRIGWVSSSSEGKMSAKFAYFQGTKGQSFDLKAGEVLTVDYSMSLKKGSLAICVTGPNGELEREEGTVGDTSGKFVIDAPVAGKYAVSLNGDGASGRYDVKIGIEENSEGSR